MNMNHELIFNVEGRMGPQQRRFLLLWLAQRMIFVVLPIMLAAYWFSDTLLGALLGLGAAVLALGFAWTYGLELWQAQVSVATGHLEKFSQRVRGPAHYYVVIDGIQIRTQKDAWQMVETGRHYEVYFSPYSKWLLSYRNM